MVGPTFYGVYTNAKVNSVTEPTTVFTSSTGISEAAFEAMNISIFPNPAADLIAMQIGGLVTEDLQVNLIDLSGRVLQKARINKGSTIAYFDVQTVYEGTYVVQIINSGHSFTHKVGSKWHGLQIRASEGVSIQET